MMQNVVKVSVMIAGVKRGVMIDLGGEKTPAGYAPLTPWVEGVGRAVSLLEAQIVEAAAVDYRSGLDVETVGGK
jgi:hypothetical protein